MIAEVTPMIDLHIHSIHSDGTLSPAEIIAEAVKNGVNLALEEIQRYYGIVTGFGTNEGGDSE